MLPYKNLIIIKDKSQIPVYKQIAVQFIGLIQEGKLPPGALLPSTRSLAFDLQLHRKTITAAYEVLVSEDWIDNLPRKGYIVSKDLPLVRPKTFRQNRSNSFSGKGVPNFQKLNPVLPIILKKTKDRLLLMTGSPIFHFCRRESSLSSFRNL
ncbi:GntR family transcriptional regulator [Chryseobacterium arachidis]|uniref:GntR family transcriptional regulator n=1 Tax=Chryseobacterium arachidis TaxID=1416778 RepID=UPI00361C2B15